MKLYKLLFAAAIALGAATVTLPAQAALSFTGVCPPTLGLGPFGGGGIGNSTDCNLLIIFNADGSIVTEAGPQTTYDSIEDAEIGVVNLTGHTISSFFITGAGIFGFDGDGVGGYLGIANAAAGMSTGFGALDNPDSYGALDAFFNKTDNNNGKVNFLTPIAANGGTDFFSLEEPININAPPIIRAPEPATMALLGIALLGAGLSRRRKS